MWGVLDQFLSAVSNAGMTFVAANVLGAREFGEYALLFTAVTILIGISRALTSEVYIVLMMDGDGPSRRRRQAQSLGAAVSIGLAVAVVGGIASVVTGALGFVAFGVASIAVLAQDAQRFALVASKRVKAAFVNDSVWALVLFALLIPMVRGGSASIAMLAFAWGIGAAAAVAVGIRQLGVVPAVPETREWFRATRGFSSYYVAEFLAVAGSGYSIVYVVSIIVGVSGAGAYRGAQAIFGPVTTLVGGLRMVALPALVRMRREGRGKVVAASVAFALVLLILSVIVTMAIWGLKDWVAPLLLGATAAAAIPLIIPMGLGRAFVSASSGYSMGIRALGGTKSSLATRIVIAVMTLVGAAVGAALGGAAGAAWGFAAASACGAAVWMWMLSRQELVVTGGADAAHQ